MDQLRESYREGVGRANTYVMQRIGRGARVCMVVFPAMSAFYLLENLLGRPGFSGVVGAAYIVNFVWCVILSVCFYIISTYAKSSITTARQYVAAAFFAFAFIAGMFGFMLIGGVE